MTAISAASSVPMATSSSSSTAPSLCTICEDSAVPVSVYCSMCKDYFCADDDTAFHKSTTMPSHDRKPVTSSTRSIDTTSSTNTTSVDQHHDILIAGDNASAVSTAAERHNWNPAATIKSAVSTSKPQMLPWSDSDDELDTTIAVSKSNNENINTNNNNINNHSTTTQIKLQQKTDGTFVQPLLKAVVADSIEPAIKSDQSIPLLPLQPISNNPINRKSSDIPTLFSNKPLSSLSALTSKRSTLRPLAQSISTPTNHQTLNLDTTTTAVIDTTHDIVDEIIDHDGDGSNDNTTINRTLSFTAASAAVKSNTLPVITQPIVSSSPPTQSVVQLLPTTAAAEAVVPADKPVVQPVAVDDDDDGWENTIARQYQQQPLSDDNENDITITNVVEQPLTATLVSELSVVQPSDQHFDAHTRTHHDGRSPSTAQYQTHTTVTTSAEQSINSKTTLSPDELTELKCKFNTFKSYQSDTQTIDVYEIGKFIHQLEFTYDSATYIDVIVQSMFHSTVHKRITYDKFIQFMYVFYHLHDTVVHTIDTQFVQLTAHDATDECIAVLCPYITFDSNSELDFTVMKQKLTLAIEHERNESYRTAELQKQSQYNIFNTTTNNIELSKSIDTLPTLIQASQPSVDTTEPVTGTVTLTSPLNQSKRQPPQTGMCAANTFIPTQPIDTPYSDEWTDIEQQYIQNEYNLYVQHIGCKLHINDMYKALQSLGFNISLQHIREIYTRVGASNAGCFDIVELKHMYTQLAALHTLDGINLQPLYMMCEWFDKNHDGIITIAEFKYVIQQLCNKQLTMFDIEYIMIVADRQNNGLVHIQSILQLIESHYNLIHQQHTDAQQLSNNTKIQTIANATINDAAMSHPSTLHSAPETSYAITVFIRKYIRAQMPQFIEHILTFACMPSNYRLSMLAQYDIQSFNIQHKFKSISTTNTFNQRYITPSSLCQATLKPNGIQFNELSIDPNTKQLRTTHPPITSIHQQHTAQYITYEFIINSVSGIPLPDGHARHAIGSRRLRMALYSTITHRAVSNIYTVIGDWHPDEEDVWRFDTNNIHDIHTHQHNQFNHIVFKTDQHDCVVVMELTCLIRKPLIHTATATHTSYDYIELSCGHTTVPLDIHNPLQHGKHILRLSGGTLCQSVAIKPNEILARRHGMKALTSYLFHDGAAPASTLTLHVNTQFDMKPVKLQNYVMYIPSQLLCSTVHIESIKIYRQILCDILCRDTLPLQLHQVNDPFIMIFLQVLDQHDVLHCVVELFNQYKQKLDKSTRSDLYNGLANEYVKTKFRLAVLHAWPLLSSVLDTSHVLGIDDNVRYGILRDCIHSNTQVSLACDGMNNVVKSVRPHTYISAVDKGIEYRNVYKPFHTAQIIYNPIATRQYRSIRVDDG